MPARERSVLRSHFTKSRVLKGRRYSDAEKEIIGRVLGQKYSTVARAVSGSYSLHVAENKTLYSGFNMGAGEDSIFELVEIMHKLPEGSLIIIEEVETGLHPSAQVKLMDEMHALAFSKYFQVILTTHSFDILKTVPDQGRIFLKRLSTCITPIYEVSPTYAFSLMSIISIPELTIYVEDKVSQNLVNNYLPFHLRNRCRILEVGSIEALSGQMVAVRKDPHLGKVLGIYDGDTPKDKFIGAFKRHLQCDLSPEDFEWLSEHTTSLPGNCTPERWIQSYLNNPQFIKNVAELMCAKDEELVPIFDAIVPLDHHDLFYELSNRLGRPLDEIQNIVAMALPKTFPDEFKKIVGVVEKLLK